MEDLTIRFETAAQRDAFVHWLDGQGEQDYWTWMESSDNPEDTVTFDYKDEETIITKST